MNKPIPIPVALVGPGSQPQPADSPETLPMPSGVATFRPPVLPEPEEVAALHSAKAILDATVIALRAYRSGDPASSIDLDGLDPDNLELINQAMGEGEVSVIAAGPSMVQVQESVFAGLWRVRHLDTNGRVVRDTLEVADIPSIVPSLGFEEADTNIDTSTDGLAENVLNAPPLLVELNDKLATWQPGDPPHVINLTLLPLSDADLVLLGSRLGVGPVTLLSRGYGNCRIGSTAKRNIWWVKYYNADDALILNLIEVSTVPEVAMAAAEDIADSARRLAEIVEFYR